MFAPFMSLFSTKIYIYIYIYIYQKVVLVKNISKSGIGKKKIMQCLCMLNLCSYLLYQPQTYKFTQQF